MTTRRASRRGARVAPAWVGCLVAACVAAGGLGAGCLGPELLVAGTTVELVVGGLAEGDVVEVELGGEVSRLVVERPGVDLVTLLADVPPGRHAGKVEHWRGPRVRCGPFEVVVDDAEVAHVLIDVAALPVCSDLVDGGSVDGGSVDGGNVDGGSVDGGNADGGNVDGGNVDGGCEGDGDGDGDENGNDCQGGDGDGSGGDGDGDHEGD